MCIESGAEILSGWSIVKDTTLERILSKVKTVIKICNNEKFRPLNLIIPMAGKGLRFRKNDYKIYKPFIKIDEKNVCLSMSQNFPKSVKIWIITCKAYQVKNK